MEFGSQLLAWRRSGSLLVVGVLAVSLGGIVFLLRPRAEIVHETIDVDGMRREYRLVVPRSVAGKRDVPVVFALHGAIDTVDEMAAHTGLDELAIEQEFLLVYLQGRHLNWPPFIPPENPTLMEPDAAFFRAMCDRVTSEHGGDRRRIYLIGVSQGGAAANLLTAMCSERIAATVVGCGWLPEPLGDAPLATANKCPMLFLVGSRDRQVPPEMVREGRDAFERAGHLVEFRVIDGFGHGWPRAENERVWEFLEGKRLGGGE
ncbi:alpha/beta hydrolase family esterase [Lacipirellula limnantheis]|uniref:Alpha/beta hydrolase family protein n=1 Tax=Lacipirellula limnantheis TaxID=2528024 RepID=A0A517U615_9BACT|nr:PHB depolymerase family esterase [Lacipirellula limnantheis]QDT76064.1 Alpha/beta hydrolase family protein [Lacipirellula limnantheis]